MTGYTDFTYVHSSSGQMKVQQLKKAQLPESYVLSQKKPSAIYEVFIPDYLLTYA